MHCTGAILQGEEDEGTSDVVEVDLDHEPTDNVVCALCRVGVRPFRERVGRGTRSARWEEEVRSDKVTQFATDRGEQAGHDKGDCCQLCTT